MGKGENGQKLLTFEIKNDMIEEKTFHGGNMSALREYLNELFVRLEFPVKATEELLCAYDGLCSNESVKSRFLEIVSRYYECINIDYDKVKEDYEALAESAGIHPYTLGLLVAASMTKKLRERYIEQGISLSVFDRSMLDLKYKVVECMEVYGVVGNFVFAWFSGFLRMKLFGLGRLQYEIVPLKLECTVDGVELKEDSQAINIHIPRTGGKLDHGEVLESYKMAKEFFREYFVGKPTVFTCCSWLLWQEHLRMLPVESNICKFIRDFTIVREYELKDYNEVWRLFDKNFDGDPDHLPADSTLRRKYIEHMKAGKPTGTAKGVFVLK